MESKAEEPESELERAVLWCLWRVRGVRHRHIAALRRRLHPVAWWENDDASARDMLAAAEFGTKTAESVMTLRDEVHDPVAVLGRESRRMPEASELLHLTDANYPSRLFLLEDPPEFLYVRGEVDALAAHRTLAAVGSRSIGVEDARLAAGIVETVAARGIAMVSGGALGTDAVVHEASLEAGASTIVVLPSALDEPTPRSNLEIFERAAEQGAVVSEYPLGVELRNYHFPRRNRLIAALGDATFVVRGDVDSGTMLTAEAAEDLDQPICALVGGLDEPLAQGCLELIADGARGVRHGRDILEAYFPDCVGATPDEGDDSVDTTDETESGEEGAPRRCVPDPAKIDGLSAEGEQLLRVACDVVDREAGPIHVDDLQDAANLSSNAVQSTLLELELHGICEKAPGAQAYRFGTLSGG